MKVDDRNISLENEVIFYPFGYYGSIGMPSFDVAKFSCPKEMKKYNKWLSTDFNIFCKPYIKKYLNRKMLVNSSLTKIFEK